MLLLFSVSLLGLYYIPLFLLRPILLYYPLLYTLLYWPKFYVAPLLCVPAPPPYIALVPLMPHTLCSVLSLQSSLTLM